MNSFDVFIIKGFTVPKTIIKVYIKESYYHKINFKVKYILAKYFLNEINCKQPLISNTVYGRRHSRLLINCHVSWDTLYINLPELRLVDEAKTFHLLPDRRDSGGERTRPRMSAGTTQVSI